MIQPRLKITITKTSTGEYDYVQIMSSDQLALNIVLIAEEIEVLDVRKAAEAKGAKNGRSY